MSNISQVDDDNEKPNIYYVAGIVLNILTAIDNNSIDAINENDTTSNGEEINKEEKFLEDTAVEQTLCAIWDLSSLEEYANILMNECQIHRIMLKVLIKMIFVIFFFHFSVLLFKVKKSYKFSKKKIITLTARKRTQELSLGVLANLACFPDMAMILIRDMDLFNVIQIILIRDEDNDDVLVLFEASRYGNPFFFFFFS